MGDSQSFQRILAKIEHLENEIREIKYAVIPVEKINEELAREIEEINERIESGEFATEEDIFEALIE